MPLVAREYLPDTRAYVCRNCGTHLVTHENLVSKAFQGRGGRAFLFNSCLNYSVGPKEDRKLITGLHTVCDIFCRYCSHPLGWKYEAAYEESQKYKVGKFIIECTNMSIGQRWAEENKLRISDVKNRRSSNDANDENASEATHQRARSRSSSGTGTAASTFSIFMNRLTQITSTSGGAASSEDDDARRQEGNEEETNDENQQQDETSDVYVDDSD